MIQIGITGGIGSGKTTVCKIFETLNIPIYYADNRAKALMTGNKEVKTRIINIFGKEAYFKNGRLNRKMISNKAFSDMALLDKLNEIVHPAVGKDYKKWVEEQNGPYVLKEAALLIEAGSYKEMDHLIIVTAPLEERIKRVVKRDKIEAEKVMARIRAQMPEEEKLSFADFVIVNDNQLSLITQVMAIHSKIMLEVK